MKQLILGGARSGKSAEAEKRAHALAQSGAQECVYVATGQGLDDEMQARIQHHQKQRQEQGDIQWKLLEEPLHLASILSRMDHPQHCILVDCLSLWLSNCLLKNCWQEERLGLFEILPNLNSSIIFVSNEVGSGVVPLGELSRSFVDESGRLHQELAAACDRVSLVVAGLSMDLKQP